MMKLKEMCIQKVCEQITRLTLFVWISPLPWSLTEEIIEKFPMFKWKALQKDAADKYEYDDTDLVDFEFHANMSPNLRSALLCTDNLEMFASNDYYCAWTHFYVIDKYNISLCKSCLLIFIDVLKEKNIKCSYSFHHFHESVLSYELHHLYQKRSSYCQNSFSEILFELKDKFDCDRDLHGTGRKRVKFCN